jgi:hypothetical protein
MTPPLDGNESVVLSWSLLTTTAVAFAAVTVKTVAWPDTMAAGFAVMLITGAGAGTGAGGGGGLEDGGGVGAGVGDGAGAGGDAGAGEGDGAGDGAGPLPKALLALPALPAQPDSNISIMGKQRKEQKREKRREFGNMAPPPKNTVYDTYDGVLGYVVGRSCTTSNLTH